MWRPAGEWVGQQADQAVASTLHCADQAHAFKGTVNQLRRSTMQEAHGSLQHIACFCTWPSARGHPSCLQLPTWEPALCRGAASARHRPQAHSCSSRARSRLRPAPAQGLLPSACRPRRPCAASPAGAAAPRSPAAAAQSPPSASCLACRFGGKQVHEGATNSLSSNTQMQHPSPRCRAEHVLPPFSAPTLHHGALHGRALLPGQHPHGLLVVLVLQLLVVGLQSVLQGQHILRGGGSKARPRGAAASGRAVTQARPAVRCPHDKGPPRMHPRQLQPAARCPPCCGPQHAQRTSYLRLAFRYPLCTCQWEGAGRARLGVQQQQQSTVRQSQTQPLDPL